VTSPTPGDQPDQKAAPEDKPEGTEPEDVKQGDAEAPEEEQRPQPAWDTQRDINRHAPKLQFDGVNRGVFADQVNGDVIQNHFHFGRSAAAQASGEYPAKVLDRLALTFVTEGTSFDGLLERLDNERVLVLTGAPCTGRRTAALMLLRRLGATPVHSLDRETRPGELLAALTEGKAIGYVLCDMVTSRDQPLRDTHLFALRSHLRDHGGFLVITTGLRPWIDEDVRTWSWEPPTATSLLRSHLKRMTGLEATHRLMGLAEVSDFLPRRHQPREIVAYATELSRSALDGIDEVALQSASLELLAGQVQEWFETDENTLHLREKAFLIALAAFNDGPYPLTAELSDLLFEALQQTANSLLPKAVPVFGTHIDNRLRLARARPYYAEEETEWGQVRQLKAAFWDDRTAFVLLREVWTGHPSARPALVEWLGQLTEDGRPFVRTRAAATAAVLASTDLPSAMALLIEPWAVSRKAQHRIGAVSALVLAHRARTPNILRIIDGWTADEDLRRSWVGIRAQGLVGDERPEAALTALRVQARKQYDPDAEHPLAGELAQSVELLLLSSAAPRAFAEVLRTLDDHPSVFELSVRGFLGACRHTGEGNDHHPLILRGYARSRLDGDPAAEAVRRLWRSALGDRVFTVEALRVLTHWVLAADADREAEWALAELLPSLITDETEEQRIVHLLQTVRGDDGGPRPPVADSLLTALHLA
jgi:hypothetical protein